MTARRYENCGRPVLRTGQLCLVNCNFLRIKGNRMCLNWYQHSKVKIHHLTTETVRLSISNCIVSWSIFLRSCSNSEFRIAQAVFRSELLVKLFRVQVCVSVLVCINFDKLKIELQFILTLWQRNLFHVFDLLIENNFEF